MNGKLTAPLASILNTVASPPVIIESVPSRGLLMRKGVMALGVKPYYDITIGPYTFITVNELSSTIIQKLSLLPDVEMIHYDGDIRFFGGFGFGIIDAIRSGIRPRDLILGETVGPRDAVTTRNNVQDTILIGTEQVRQEVKADRVYDMGYTGSNTKVAVIDTGMYQFHTGAKANAVSDTVSTLNVMKRGDTSGHGTWSCAAVGYGPASTRTGIKTRGIGDAQLISIKALRTPLGVARDSDILKAMDMAMNKHGAKIISMSLGANATVTSSIDPKCKIISYATQNMGKIFVVAAGNSGPLPGTIDSPGICPDAVTVGAYSITDKDASWFSSRGPTIDGFNKPDILAPGGGRVLKETRQNELLVGPTAYLSSLDKTDKFIGLRPRNSFAALQGTSQATPIVAGIIAQWNDYSLAKSGREITAKVVKSLFKGNKIDATWGVN